MFVSYGLIFFCLSKVRLSTNVCNYFFPFQLRYLFPIIFEDDHNKMHLIAIVVGFVYIQGHKMVKK